MSYDEGLLERCIDALRALGLASVRHRNVFGARGLLRGSTMFAAVGETSIIVKLTPAEFAQAIQDGTRPFMPGGQKLGTWVEVDADADAVADDPDLRAWLQAGLRAIR